MPVLLAARPSLATLRPASEADTIGFVRSLFEGGNASSSEGER